MLKIKISRYTPPDSPSPWDMEGEWISVAEAKRATGLSNLVQLTPSITQGVISGEEFEYWMPEAEFIACRGY